MVRKTAKTINNIKKLTKQVEKKHKNKNDEIRTDRSFIEIDKQANNLRDKEK
jgi:hypothetical protein